MATKVVTAMGGVAPGVRIAVLGLTFKPNTDDMREAPSLTILPALQKLGAVIRAFDPEGMNEAQKALTDIEYTTNPYDACSQASAILILTEWNQFRNLNLARIHQVMTPLPDGRRCFFDLRNIYDPAILAEAGFHYVSVGR